MTQRYAVYETALIKACDIETHAELVVERYVLSYPLLDYWSLQFGDDGTIVDEFYGTSKRGERVYDKYRVYLKANVSPEEMGMTIYSIDVTRQVVFHAAEPTLQQLGIVPKEGDVIVFDGDLYEVQIARRWQESRLGHTEYYGQVELITTKAPTDFDGQTNE